MTLIQAPFTTGLSVSARIASEMNLMNSISVPTDMNKNTDTAAMELMIGNMNLRISNETDPLLLAKTIQILAELSC